VTVDDAVPSQDAAPEPTDNTAATESWPTARGPHLPDAVHRFPWMASLFAVFALARLGWGIREAGLGPTFDPWQVGQIMLFEVPSVVAILLPAALLARHPDAARRLRPVLAGTILLAVVEGLRVLSSPLEPVFEWLTPGDRAASFLVVSALAYNVAVNLLNSLGVSAIGLGLARARRSGDRAVSWPVDAVLAGLVVLIGVTGVVSVGRLPAGQLPMTPTVLGFIVSTVVLNVVSATAFGYLAAVTTAGLRAAEQPIVVWRLGAFGSWLVVGSLAALGLVGIIQATPESAELTNNVVLAIEVVFSLGFIGVLAAFAVGLPRLDPLERPDEASDDLPMTATDAD